MYKSLSPNVKISITRSITQTFEQYMSNINWNQDKFNIENYIASWQKYITTRALWYSEISDEIKRNSEFQEQLAEQINKTIDRILSEPPTEEQIATIQMMQEKLNTYFEYDCKAQASYIERLLASQLNDYVR